MWYERHTDWGAASKRAIAAARERDAWFAAQPVRLFHFIQRIQEIVLAYQETQWQSTQTDCPREGHRLNDKERHVLKQLIDLTGDVTYCAHILGIPTAELQEQINEKPGKKTRSSKHVVERATARKKPIG